MPIRVALRWFRATIYAPGFSIPGGIYRKEIYKEENEGSE
jgi:hypothetical protein